MKNKHDFLHDLKDIAKRIKLIKNDLVSLENAIDKLFNDSIKMTIKKEGE